MSNMLKRMSKKVNSFQMGMKFKCENCGYEKIIPQAITKNMSEEEFKKTKIFNCKHCNNKMMPISIEVDY